ncbi:hypothetical protein BC940DRAFT_320335 [Gongronella butleri]|nr:hypothetical protein BC940DRAFT_320335 [Gongronella butleri]
MLFYFILIVALATAIPLSEFQAEPDVDMDPFHPLQNGEIAPMPNMQTYFEFPLRNMHPDTPPDTLDLNDVTLRKCDHVYDVKHLIYMMVTNKTDTKYLENIRLHNEIVYVSEVPEDCPATGCCMILETGFDYWFLQRKVRVVMTAVLHLFPNFETLSKMDDDAFVDYNFFHDLQKQLNGTSFVGKFMNAECRDQNIEYPQGAFYIMGRTIVNCLLDDYTACSGSEDVSVAANVYHNCPTYQRIDLHYAMNIDVFHRMYGRKNKLIYLGCKDRSAPYKMEKQDPPLDVSKPHSIIPLY